MQVKGSNYFRLREVGRYAVFGVRTRFFYRGTEHECPLCQTRISHFRGDRYLWCPRCGAGERHRLLWLYLTREMEIMSQSWKVLHFAPEPPLRRILSRQQHLDYVTGDLDPRFADLEVDITKLEFEDDSFDLVLCSHVLEHVPDDGAAMREVRRVLKPTGQALFQQPIDFSRATTHEDSSIVDPAARLQEFGQGDHVRYYGRDFPQRLVAAGMDVEEEGYALDDRAEGEYYGIVESGDRRGSDIYVGRPAAASSAIGRPR